MFQKGIVKLKLQNLVIRGYKR